MPDKDTPASHGNPVSETAPRYQHDHDGCTFLGSVTLRHRHADLYHCTQGGHLPTVIARFSSDGPDYHSGLALADHDPFLGEARARAVTHGLLPATSTDAASDRTQA